MMPSESTGGYVGARIFDLGLGYGVDPAVGGPTSPMIGRGHRGAKVPPSDEHCCIDMGFGERKPRRSDSLDA